MYAQGKPKYITKLDIITVFNKLRTSAKSNVARTWPQTPDERPGPLGRLTQKPVRRALGATPITARGAPYRPRANFELVKR